MIEAEDSAEPGHVHIKGDDEFGFVDGFPQPGVNLVFADHPAEEEVEALAGAASFGACEEILEAGGDAAIVLVGFATIKIIDTQSDFLAKISKNITSALIK